MARPSRVSARAIMPPRLFGTDGIRGRYGQSPLDSQTIYAVGLALAAHVHRKRNPKVLIGMDTRASSPEIVRLLAGGLTHGGVTPRFAGVVPTPTVAHATRQGDYALGIVVSASHNPFQDNGIKVFGPFGYKLPDEIETSLEHRVRHILANGASPEAVELEEHHQIALDYIQYLAQASPLPAAAMRLSFVVDCANGAASEIAPFALESMGVNVSYIACEPDGRNINEGCGALHMAGLAEEVVARGADFGAALDGDADRCLFVDESGNLLDGDNVLFAAALALKRRKQLHDNLVVATVMSNMGLDVELQQHGIRLLRTRVGDRHVIDEMLSSGAALGGEQSGHAVFGDHSTTGDGLLTLLIVLGILAEEGISCSDLRSRLRVFPQRLVNVQVREKRPFGELPEIRREIADRELQLAGRGRIVIRYSGTEPVVRVMVEAERHEQVVRHSTAIASLFEKYLGK